MAYLSVLGPLKDVVGAHVAVQARARGVVGGQCPQEGPAGRGVGAVAADTALRLLSGRAVGQLQPVEVHLVMTDRALLGTGDPDRSVFEPARIPGHGSVPAPAARAWLREGLTDPPGSGLAHGGVVEAEPATQVVGAGLAAGAVRGGRQGAGDGAASDDAAARVWVRRLYTTPEGRDLVAMDRRGWGMRRMLVLRDDVCTTAWCQAPIVHADHADPCARARRDLVRGRQRQVHPVQLRQGGPRLAHPRDPHTARASTSRHLSAPAPAVTRRGRGGWCG